MKFLDNLKLNFSNAAFKVKEHSPSILIGVGVVGVLVSTVLACKATTKVDGIIDECKKEVNEIKKTAEDENLKMSNSYPKKQLSRDLTVAYAKTTGKLLKVYAPSVLIMGLSLTSILGSNRVLTNRNAALASAYSVVSTSFKEYRGRVKDRFGERVDYELRNGIHKEIVEEEVTDEKGKTKKVKKEIDVTDKEILDGNDYCRFFDELNPNWVKDNPDANRLFLKQMQNWANDTLKSRGYLFLNDVYKALGFNPVPYGQLVGWVYSEEYGKDNYIDFGINDSSRQSVRDFVNGFEPAILLEFNVDGNIMELFPKTARY